MTKVISIHEYVLKSGVQAEHFEQAVRHSRDSGLLRLPGLLKWYLVKGIRGTRKGSYAAVWVYESREAWEKLWGPMDKPIGKEGYPENWKVWEDEVLAPFLDQDPDTIVFTAYREVW